MISSVHSWIFDSYIYLSPAVGFLLPGSSIIWEYKQNDAVLQVVIQTDLFRSKL